MRRAGIRRTGVLFERREGLFICVEERGEALENERKETELKGEE